MMKKTITISGGYHNAGDINLRVDLTGITDLSGKQLLWAVLERLTPSQMARVDKHMCGIATCTCGPEHGWEIVVN